MVRNFIIGRSRRLPSRTIAQAPRLAVVGISMLASIAAHAGPRDQAYRIYNRLTGVPPTAPILDQMTQLIEAGKPAEAAQIATATSYFYNLTLPTFVKPWTNEDESVRVPLNDYVATIVGIVRDDLPFTQALHADILYTASDSVVANPANGVPAYAPNNNDHYAALERNRVDLKESLVRQTQSQLNGIPDAAGVLTSRAAGEAFFQDGTNRAIIRFTLKSYLCSDLEQFSDTTTPDFRVRQDVTRSPGGDSTVFRNRCAGCHGGMDGFSGAFAYLDFVNGALSHDATRVRAKYLRNASEFPDGYVTTDDSWLNLWVDGQNASFGWKGAESGNGASEWGEMISKTDAMASCMTKKVFKTVCLREPTRSDAATVESLQADFAKNGAYNMKRLFERTAIACSQE